MMTLEEFRDLLDAKGPDPDDWPRRQRRTAKRLLLGSADARVMYDAARRADAFLTEALWPAPLSPALRVRLEAIPLAHPRAAETTRVVMRRLRPWWYAGAATAMASVIAGFVVGAMLPAEADLNEPVPIASLIYGPSNGGLLP
jgi:anti-sigma-K factor RskA